MELQMPRPIRPPARILTDDESLSPETQATLASALEGADAPSHLAGLGHCLRILLLAVIALADRVGRRAIHLRHLLDSLSALVACFPPKPSEVRTVPVGEDFGLWSVLVLTDPDASPKRLLELIGAAYWLGQSTGERANRPVMELLARAAQAASIGPAPPELLAALEMKAGPLWIRISTSLMKGAQSKRTAAADFYEQRIERRLISARAFVHQSRLDAVVATRDLTAADVVACASVLKERALAGDFMAFTNCVAHWLGILPYEAWNVRLFAPVGTGMIRLSVDCAVAHFDLSGLLADLAASTPGAQQTSDVLPLVLPQWMASILFEFRRSEPEAATLAEAAGCRLAANAWRLTSEPSTLPRRISASRWVASRAQPLLDADADQHLTSVCCVDPSRAGKSATHYLRMPLTEIAELLALRSDLLGWGPLARTPSEMDVDLGIGSRVTPLHATVLELIEARRLAVERSRPGPNAGWSKLVVHSNHVVLYALLVCSLGWALRGQNEIHPVASLIREHELRGWMEKRLGKNSGSPTPLTCGVVLRRQLELLGAHYLAMLERGQRRIDVADVGMLEILRIFECASAGDGDVPLLLFVDGNCVRAARATDLVWGLNLNCPFKRDALRHFAADAFRTQGSPAELVEDLMRHVVNCSELFTAAAGLSVREWKEHAANAQDKLLGSLGIHPLPGLVSRVRKGGSN
jgi:hypothetical protein